MRKRKSEMDNKETRERNKQNKTSKHTNHKNASTEYIEVKDDIEPCYIRNKTEKNLKKNERENAIDRCVAKINVKPYIVHAKKERANQQEYSSIKRSKLCKIKMKIKMSEVQCFSFFSEFQYHLNGNLF